MGYSLAQLKALQNESIDKIASASSSNKFKDDFYDDTFWQLEKDKAGNGFAIIRFLPAPAEESLPWVEVFEHGYQGPGGWYINRSPSTLGLPCPVYAYAKTLYDSGTEENKELAKKLKRRSSRISNILVISDPRNKHNEGKKFRFRYGMQIWDKIDGQLNPKFEGQKRVNPFNPYSGCDFHLKVFDKDKFPTYTESSFQQSSPLLGGDDDKIQELLSDLYPLASRFHDPKYYKSYEELEKALQKALKATPKSGLTSQPRSVGAPPPVAPPPTPTPKPETVTPPWENAPATTNTDAPTGGNVWDSAEGGDDYYERLLA